ncbi:potassium transporter KefA [Erysipelotrichaceae bacterium MTC7]|nr:potassium transporter KefA [Erysipelotrichaceae bacterium MTC7]
MRNSKLRFILGWVLKIEAACMLFPVLTGFYYQEDAAYVYLGVAIVTFILGYILTLHKPKTRSFRAKEGFLVVALSWIVLSAFGMLPFILTGEIPQVHDALFEIVSGFTTTGASIVPNPDVLSKATILWRSFSHWIGGMGVLVFVLTILPIESNQQGNTIHVMRAESPGPSVGKLVPRIKDTARILYGIYFVMTVVLIVVLIIAGMPIYDAITMGLGTAGTGGFSVSSAGAGIYSPQIQVILTIGMIAFGINFNIYYLLLLRRFKSACKSEELRAYLGIIIVAIVLISLNIYGQVGNLWDTILQSSFQVGSIITTTGYTTVDYNQWPMFSQLILLGLMLVGAMAGSTGGGFKIQRLVIICKNALNQLRNFISPRRVQVVQMDGKLIENDVVASTKSYLVLYIIIMGISVLIVSLDNFDLMSTFSAVNATFNNIGPGMNMAGPVESFAGFSMLSKLTMTFDMLAGRLEIIPMLLLFSPTTWRQ